MHGHGARPAVPRCNATRVGTARRAFAHPTSPVQSTSPMPPIPGRAFAVTLGMVAFIGPLAIHLYFPVIPAVKAAFVLSEALAQLTFTIAVFGMGAATLAYGSLADRHGRRPVLLSGLALFLVGTDDLVRGLFVGVEIGHLDVRAGAH